MKSIFDEAGAIVARAIQSGLITVAPAKPVKPVLTPEQKRQRNRDRITAYRRSIGIKPQFRHCRREDFATFEDYKRAARRAACRRYRWMRRKNETGVYQCDFPDTPEGTLAYQSAYRKAWLKLPGNQEKMQAALKAWWDKNGRVRK